MWWSDLVDEQRLYYAGALELVPSELLEQKAREYNDLETRVYRPFNHETMWWSEYVHTSDYLVHCHHELKLQLMAKDARQKLREHLNNAHGNALADCMSTQDETVPECDGCRLQEPSQKYHQCLGYE